MLLCCAVNAAPAALCYQVLIQRVWCLRCQVLAFSLFSVLLQHRADIAATTLQLYFAGPLDTAMRLLKEGGMLDPALLDTTKPSKVWKSQAHINKDPVQVDAASIPHMPSSGVEAWTFHNYYETVMMVGVWVRRTNGCSVNVLRLC